MGSNNENVMKHNLEMEMCSKIIGAPPTKIGACHDNAFLPPSYKMTES